MSASEVPTVRERARTERRAGTSPGSGGGERPRAAALGTADAAAGAPLLLSRYRLLRRLGAGAFGVVWQAHDERLEREVAIKMVPRERVMAGRLDREARAAARLSHPGIVTLYEAAADDEGAYLVSELVRGHTLQALLAAERLSDHDAVAIAVSLCDALAHAHAQGVIHRDVKPSNILVPEQPSSPAHPAKLTDFGVARLVGGDALTRTGDVVGTAAYMSPEQAEGLQVGPAADLYALALVTYEALTGMNPVRTGAASARARRLGAYLPPLRRQRRDLPRELACALDLALRPRPRERGTLTELREGLSCSLEQLDDTPRLADTRAPIRFPPPAAGGEPLAPRVPVRAPDSPAAEPGAPAPTLPVRWPARATAALAAALFVALVVAQALPGSPLGPASAAAAAGVLILLLPRLGWLTVAGAITVSAVVLGRPGAALMVVLTFLLPALLLPRRGVMWPLAAAAPALGLAGLAGAWPALAGYSSRGPWRRAALGMIGWGWLASAAALEGRDVYVRRPPGLTSPSSWMSSLANTVDHVLVPLAHSGILLAAPVWGLAALVLPWLLRRRSLVVDAVAAVAWSSGTVAGVQAAITAAHRGAQPVSGASALIGGAAAVILVLIPTITATRRVSPDAEGLGPQLP